MTDQEKVRHLSELVAKFNAALSTAEEFAIEHGLSFKLEPAYGMGGYFDGTKVGKPDEYGDVQSGWNPSSMSC